MEDCRVIRAATHVRAERFDRTEIFGVGISAITLDDAVDAIERWIGEGAREYVCITGVHGVIECRHDERLRRIHNEAGMATPDGMPLVWFSRLAGSGRTRRVYGPDLMRRMTKVSAERGYRHFYYGGAEKVADRLGEVLSATFPGIQVAGAICPPFRTLTKAEDDAIVDAINSAKPDIVWVGLSTPKQERWMAEHRSRIQAPVLIGVGAAFDFLSGTKRQAPLFMQRNGLEWLFRLCSEPRRLWRRYGYIVPAFAILAAVEIMRRTFTRAQSAHSQFS